MKRSDSTKERMMHLLFEYLKDSKRSDRELAKVVGVSQPTITRMRSKLVKEGMIREFTVIPDFTRMGYTIMAVTCARFATGKMEETRDKGVKWVYEHPNILFGSRAQGMGKNAVMISLHKDYKDYDAFLSDLESDWGNHIEEWGSMLINLEGPILKPLSLKYLAEQET